MRQGAVSLGVPAENRRLGARQWAAKRNAAAAKRGVLGYRAGHVELVEPRRVQPAGRRHQPQVLRADLRRRRAARHHAASRHHSARGRYVHRHHRVEHDPGHVHGPQHPHQRLRQLQRCRVAWRCYHGQRAQCGAPSHLVRVIDAVHDRRRGAGHCRGYWQRRRGRGGRFPDQLRRGGLHRGGRLERWRLGRVCRRSVDVWMGRGCDRRVGYRPSTAHLEPGQLRRRPDHQPARRPPVLLEEQRQPIHRGSCGCAVVDQRAPV